MSTTSCAMVLRAKQNDPYIPLSAFAIASIIKNYQNQGGWGSESLEFAMKIGLPSQAYWPQGKVQRALDTAEMREDAGKRKIAEAWQDLGERNFDAAMTCLLLGEAGIGDFNWWAHSVCLLDPVEIEKGSFGIRIWNSWADEWGENGTGILQGSKAIPDSCWFPRAVSPSEN
jgi:hypothetical protein